MRIKGVITAILLCLATVDVFAQQLTEKESMERALLYINDIMQPKGNAGFKAPARGGLSLKAAKVEADKIYAFNVNGGGYVIASADSRTLPILGYSNEGTFDWDKMPENMRAWLKSYDEAIATLGNRMDYEDGNELYADSSSRKDRVAIEPLIKTRWNQDTPYWDQVPLYDGAYEDWVGERCYTGCVATAMAQVMKYYEWPKAATTDVPGYGLATISGGVKKTWQIDDLPSVTFDWDNMLDDYIGLDTVAQQYVLLGTMEQRQAVATLMRYCGQSVEMEYTPEGSGASGGMVPQALYNYFGYAPTAYLASRFIYGIDEWESLIYDEIAAGRPVPYDGFNDNSGHAFICDGYDGSGLFHFNWGWGGAGDGYFSLSVLNPTSRALGYCLGQEAVIGIKPVDDGALPVDSFHVNLNDAIDIIRENNLIYFYYAFTSYFYSDVTQDYAMGTIEPDGTLTPRFIGDPSDSIVYGGNWMTVEIDPSLMQPGDTLTLYPMVRFRNIPGSDWQMLGSEKFHVYAVLSQSGELFLYAEAAPEMEILSVDILPDDNLYAGELTLTIRNKDDFEYTDVIYLQACYYGDNNPGEIDDTLIVYSGYWMSGAFLRAGQNTDVTFSRIDLTCEGLVRLDLYSEDGVCICSYYVDFRTPTDIKAIESDPQPDTYYDLQGRDLNALPGRNGIYIKGNRKILVR